jgi:TRAP-type mannitol/chloroaromatic compound transport system substrate-binding protein
MRRRDILAGAALAFPMPAIAQGLRQLKMVTDWPAGSPGLQTSAERLAQRIGTATGGRIKIEVYPAGEFVRPFETFDAVSSGVADMYHSAEYYWEKKSPAFDFFAAVPFGFTAAELFAWVQYGGGQDLWDELSGQYQIKPLLCCNTGTQMGGWSTREISAPDGFSGLRYRMPGLGGEVLRRMGAIVVNVPGGEIASTLKSGAIDGSEWVGPWLDMALGLHRAARYYYYPGFHEPGSGLSLGINRAVWDSLGGSDQRVFEDASAAEYLRSLAEFNANNAWALRDLLAQGDVKVLEFDRSFLKRFVDLSHAVVAEAGSGDELSKKIYASYQGFRAPMMDWIDIAERAFLNARGLG